MRRRLLAMPSLSRKNGGRKKQGRGIMVQNRLARQNRFARRNQLRRLLFAQKMRVQFGRMRQRKRRGKMQSMLSISMRKNRTHARTFRRIRKQMQKIVHTRRIHDAGKIIFQEGRKFAKIKIRCLKNFAEKKIGIKIVNEKTFAKLRTKIYFKFNLILKPFSNIFHCNSVSIFRRRFAEFVLAIFISTRTNQN